MSSLFRNHVLVRGFQPILAGALTLASIAGVAHAQTTPQLLPYTAKLIAGNGTVTTYTVGQTCPSGAPNTATDTYGDGCMGTDIVLTGPRYAIADTNGNVFFSDYTNGLIRRVDATTGIVTAVAGGASSTPAHGASCGTGSTATSSDAIGDGCLGTQVKLGKPAGLAFDNSGNLYFADPYNYNVRKVLATNGFITTTGTISLIDGNTGGANTTSDGYEANNGSLTSCAAPGANCITAATQGLLRGPYAITVDSSNNVLIADEYYYALLAVNPTTSAHTVATVSIPAGTVGKVAGAQSSANPVCTNGTASTSGCAFGIFTSGNAANTSVLDSPWGVAIDGSNNIYISNEYNAAVAMINGTTGIITNFSGEQGMLGKSLANTIRNTAASFATGAALGASSDAKGNVYLPDETNGFIWRVDGATTTTGGPSPGTGQLEYVIGGGGSTLTAGAACSSGSTLTAVDAFGDGCPARLAIYGANGGNGSNTTLGVYGVNVDTNANVFIGDAKNNLVREIASGTQFGVVGANQPTDTLDVHFGVGDTQITPVTVNGVTTYPSFTLTAGATNFALGTPVCTTNNDNTPANTKNPLVGNTTDCLLPVKATPSALGAFTGTLQVTSALGAVNSFPLSGVYAQSPSTRTALSYAAGVNCTGTTTYSTTTPTTLTATVIANGPNPPTGSADKVTFYANNVAIGSPVQVTNTGTSSSPAYTATLTYTFTTPGTYTLTAVYSGDSYFKASTGTSPATITSATPGYTITPISSQQGTVTAGQTGLYSFNVNQTVYNGTISFAVTGLPANASYSISPQSITGTGCSGTSTVSLSINTQQQQTVQPGSLGGFGGGAWRIIAVLNALLAASFSIFARKRMKRFRQIAMAFALLLLAGGSVGCGKGVGTVLQPGTPSGNYTITVTASGSSGSSATPITFTLTVQ